MSSKTNILTIAATQPTNPPENPIEIPDGSSPVAILLATAVLIGAIAKLIQVLVPVMMIKDKECK